MLKGFTNDEVKTLFLFALRAHAGNVSEACQAAHISRVTYYNWLDSDQEFAFHAGMVGEEVLDLAESKLLQAIEAGDVQAIKFLLNAKGKERGYGNKLEVGGVGGGAIPIAHHLTAGYPPEPKTIDEWEEQVKRAKLARAKELAGNMEDSSAEDAEDAGSAHTQPGTTAMTQ